MRLFVVLSVLAAAEGIRRRLENLDKDMIVPNTPGSYLQPVNFRNYKVEGYGDIDMKQPIDLLELDMIVPKNAKEAKEFLKKTPLRNIQFLKKSKKKQRPEVIDSGESVELGEDYLNDRKNTSNPIMFNLAEILESNLQKRGPRPKYIGALQAESHGPQAVVDINDKYFAKNTYELRNLNNGVKQNWTSCNEFSKGAHFHPMEIVNINWIPFYIWTTRPMIRALVHRFSIPTKKLVRKYIEELGLYLNKTVIDWEQPKLVLKEDNEMLMIAVDRKGSFIAIPYLELAESVKGTNYRHQTFNVRLKIDDPYLAMIYCDDEYTLIMAAEGNVPNTLEDKMIEAGTLGFQGKGFPVSRDIEGERLRETAEKELTKAEEERKLIHIPVDKEVDVPKYIRYK